VLFNSTKTFLYVEPQSLEQKRSNKESKVNNIWNIIYVSQY